MTPDELPWASVGCGRGAGAHRWGVHGVHPWEGPLSMPRSRASKSWEVLSRAEPRPVPGLTGRPWSLSLVRLPGFRRLVTYFTHLQSSVTLYSIHVSGTGFKDSLNDMAWAALGPSWQRAALGCGDLLGGRGAGSAGHMGVAVVCHPQGDRQSPPGLPGASSALGEHNPPWHGAGSRQTLAAQLCVTPSSVQPNTHSVQCLDPTQ